MNYRECNTKPKIAPVKHINQLTNTAEFTAPWPCSQGAVFCGPLSCEHMGEMTRAPVNFPIKPQVR